MRKGVEGQVATLCGRSQKAASGQPESSDLLSKRTPATSRQIKIGIKNTGQKKKAASPPAKSSSSWGCIFFPSTMHVWEVNPSLSVHPCAAEVRPANHAGPARLSHTAKIIAAANSGVLADLGLGLPPFESRQGSPPRGSLPFQGINISIF
jgi:hypothetical protein